MSLALRPYQQAMTDDVVARFAGGVFIPAKRVDYAANLALFLVEKEGSVLAEWAGRMSAAEQRALFGQFIGKGVIVINGAREEICNRVKVCFGLDYDDRNVRAWRDL